MLYEIVDMSEWKTKKVLLKELKSAGIILTERALRNIIIKHNDLYMEHESDIYIAHSNRGYKATRNTDEIKASINDNRKRAINMLVNNARTLKAIGENANLNLIIENGEMKESVLFNGQTIN